MRGPVAVGVDIGSTTVRAVAVDRSGAVVADSSAGYPPTGLSVGEADPHAWLAGAIAAIASLEVEPEAICFGGQGPTTVAAEGELALTFRHPAGASELPPDQHTAQLEVLRSRYGDDIEARQLWDWVAARVGGDPDTQSHWPNAPVLRDFGRRLPTGSVLGHTDGRHGLPAGILIAAGANDGYLTAWGSGIDVPGKGFDPGGTTGGLGVAVLADDHPEALGYGMASAVPGVVIVGGPTAAHGAMLEWWSRITGRDIPILLDAAAGAPAGAMGVIALPYFEGERAPRWNHGLRAEITGLHLDHDSGIVTRALLEATAYGLAHIARDLETKGVSLTRLVSSGGPSRSRLWSQIKADVLEVPVDVTMYPQMAAFGAALGAGAAAGWWPRPGEGTADDWPLPETYTLEPQANDVYREQLRRFIALGDAAEARVS
jgi:xylulokinase